MAVCPSGLVAWIQSWVCDGLVAGWPVCWSGGEGLLVGQGRRVLDPRRARARVSRARVGFMVVLAYARTLLMVVVRAMA